MEKSFRTILADMMTEPTASSQVAKSEGPQKAQPLPTELAFSWKSSTVMGRGSPALIHKSRYGSPVKAPSASERLLPTSALSGFEQKLWERWLTLGGYEVRDGLAPKLLKRSYRRLVKALHPDLSPGTALQFMEVKKVYSELAPVVARLFQASSGSALDNESVSAPGTRPPNAA